MNEMDYVRRQIHMVLTDMQYLTRLLQVVRDSQVRHLALQQLWNQIGYMQFLVGQLCREPAALPAAPPALPQPASPTQPAQPNQPTLPTITQEQLAAATGRNGNPAYVAVNGTVYDVTDNKAWSAATHFGLPAGRDLTREFASCHAAQQWILTTLKPVGRLA